MHNGWSHCKRCMLNNACASSPTTELRELANQVRVKKGLPEVEDTGDDDDDSSPWTPQTRVEMAQESYERRVEEEARKRHMQEPERDYEKEHTVCTGAHEHPLPSLST